MKSITINVDDNIDLLPIYNQLKKQYPKFEIVKNQETIKNEKKSELLKSDLLLPPSMSTKNWKFNREEANER